MAAVKSKAPPRPSTARETSGVVVPRVDRALLYSHCEPPLSGPPRAAESSNINLPSVGYVLLKAEVLERPPDATSRLI